ncbi:MAG: SDR family oxidoreductase [Deltaproteobacteria bacterium]|nr:SDR family oxidoreductase [Deltaproteobacteria bacterium]
MKSDVLAKKLAVITGASSGIGKALAWELGQQGFDLVLTARSQAKLADLANEIGTAYGISVQVLPADLATTRGAQALGEVLQKLARPIDLLVNNAGFGTYGEFTSASSDLLAQMLTVNAIAPTLLSRAVLPDMIKRRAGTIVNIASSAGLQAVPFMAAYAASKAYLVHLSEALWAEARPHGVRVTTICPGPVQTPFLENMGDLAHAPSARILGKPLPIHAVVKAVLQAMQCDRPSRIVGGRNLILAQGGRFLSRKQGVKVSALMFAPASKPQLKAA